MIQKLLRMSGVCASFAVLPLLLHPFASNSQETKGSEINAGSKGSEQALLKAFKQRSTGLSCEPLAPIQTRIVAPTTANVGGVINIRFEAMLMESTAPGEYRVDVPSGVRLVAGKPQDSGSMTAKKAYAWDSQIIVDRPGTYEVTVQVIAGDDSYRYGQRRSLYIISNGDHLDLATEKPKVTPVPQVGPLPAPPETDFDMPLPREVGAPPIPAPFKGKTDPYGNTLDAEPGNGIQASVTVNGTWRYRHTDSSLHAGYGTIVQAWDDDSIGADDYLAGTVVDGAGNYSLTFDNADDIFSGTADVYLVFISENSRVQVHNAGGTSGYSTATGVIWNDIGGGTYNAPSYYADWGTNGVSDSSERAFQLCDDLTTAWQHWNYYSGILFDNHLTYCQWYVGSTDGSYYLTAENRVYIEDSDVSSPDVIFHEYGHSMHDGLFSDVQWPPGTGGPHGFTGHYTTGLAWTEGFGTYYSCTAQGNDWTYNSYDPGNLINFDCDANWDGNGSANGNSDGLSTGGNTGYDTESAVLSFMLDLDDGRNDATDPYDWSTFGDDEIYQVMRNYSTGGHRPYSVQEFFNGWHANIGLQNPKVNGQMQVHGMTQPINFPALGIYTGVDAYAGTWYYGGYGRGSYDVKNYSSRNYNLNALYVWLRGPAGQDIGQFGSDGNNTPIASGAVRNIWITADQTGYNPGAPNFVYGNYTITAGHYRSDGAWQLLEPAESGTATQITKNVIQDTDAPDFCTATDDGSCQNSSSQLHVYATAQDYDSSIKGYWTRVGTSPGLGDEQDWVFHAANNQNAFDYTFTGLTMNANTVYYVTVVARNIENYDTWAYTDGIIAWDATAPGAVTVTDDGVSTSSTTQLHFVATSSEPDGCIAGYWTRVGTAAGLGDEQDWIFHATGDIDLFDHTLTGLTMNVGTTYFITVVARNMSGMDTWGYSNGIIVGRAISGTVTLADYVGDKTIPSVEFEIRNVGSGANLDVRTTHLSSTGTYSFYTTAGPGTYDIYCKPSHWLKRRRGSVTILATGAVSVNFTNRNGDCDGDNEVGIGDYAIMSAAYNSIPGDGNWNIDADLNGDDSVDIADYAILSAQYGNSGDD